jgi:hypothetical protein
VVGIKYTSPRRAESVAFIGDEASREHILVGGAMLHAADFAGRGTDDDNFVEAGTLVGRTRLERTNGRGFGPYTDGDEEVYLLARSVRLDEDTSCTLYRHGSLVHASGLPASITGTAANLTKVRELYEMAVG